MSMFSSIETHTSRGKADKIVQEKRYLRTRAGNMQASLLVLSSNIPTIHL